MSDCKVMLCLCCLQESDRTCPCRAGYQEASEGDEDCIREVYDLCRRGKSRSQHGTCYSNSEWNDHCSLQVMSRFALGVTL